MVSKPFGRFLYLVREDEEVYLFVCFKALWAFSLLYSFRTSLDAVARFKALWAFSLQYRLQLYSYQNQQFQSPLGVFSTKTYQTMSKRCSCFKALWAFSLQI